MQLPHLQKLIAAYELLIMPKKQTIPTPDTMQQLRYIEMIGAECLHTLLMKIVFVLLKYEKIELFETSKAIYTKLDVCLKPKGITRETANQLFYHLYHDYQFTSLELIQGVEKELVGIVASIVADYREELSKGGLNGIPLKPYHTIFADRVSPEKRPELSLSKQKSIDIIAEKVQIYLNKEVNHPKTQLTEFCHQMRIPEPNYIKEAEGKIFKLQCKVTIPEETKQFRQKSYIADASNLNSKLAMIEAARKVLKRIYCENQAIWERFRQIKRKKKIVA